MPNYQYPLEDWSNPKTGWYVEKLPKGVLLNLNVFIQKDYICTVFETLVYTCPDADLWFSLGSNGMIISDEICEWNFNFVIIFVINASFLPFCSDSFE